MACPVDSATFGALRLALQRETFEVVRFLKGGGVIGSVVAGPQFAKRSTGVAHGAADGGEEFRFVDVCRARGGDQDASRAEPGQGGGVEPGVGVDGSGPFGFAAGERRRVDDNQIE